MRLPLILSIVAASACSGIVASVPGPSQSQSTIDAGFSSLPADWTCLEKPAPEPPSANLELELFLDNTGTSIASPIGGADVRACNALDIGCEAPLGDVMSDDAGIALLTVPGGFTGYYEVRAPDFTPAVLARAPQYSSEYQAQGLGNLMLLSAGASFAGITQDPSLSIAVVTALDCTSTPSAGIVFSVAAPGANEQVVYLLNNVPAASASQTDSASGAALVFNVPPPSFEVTASFAATNEPIRAVSTLAREGWVTYVEIRPDQATHPGLP